MFAAGVRVDHVRHAALHDELRGLIERLSRVVGARRLALVELAEAARSELKQDRLEAAEAAVAALRTALARTEGS